MASDPRKNKDGGSQAADQMRKKKAATSGKGRHNQGRGNSESNATPKYAKKQKLGKTDFKEDMVF